MLRKYVRVLTSVAVLSSLAACVSAGADKISTTAESSYNHLDETADYFDPHSHVSGVLPFQAFANPERYLALGEGGVSFNDRYALFKKLRDQSYGNPRDAYGVTRFGLGTKATFAVFGDLSALNPDTKLVDGVLERVLSATPYTEFDSAYAMREGPVKEALLQRFSSIDLARLLCQATVMELARNHLTESEQSLNFIGGWQLTAQGASLRKDNIQCFMHAAEDLKKAFDSEGLHSPRVRILLMTHTSELGAIDRHQYRAVGVSGRCEVKSPVLLTTAEAIGKALLGRSDNDASLIIDNEMQHYFNTVVGIDTAGVESTCFTDAGMAHYQSLVHAVYDAARTRRNLGWTGKLLVHTHVGEGFTDYYDRPGYAPSYPWSFNGVFDKLPGDNSYGAVSEVMRNNSIGSSVYAQVNVDKILDAIAQLRSELPGLENYVVFRLGHVTHITLRQAKNMAALGVEADVNLDSNISTGAYSLSMIPQSLVAVNRIRPLLENSAVNFSLNKLSKVLIHDDEVNDPAAVGGILGNSSLRYLLNSGVCVMLGTDGAGSEHAPMPRQYALAASLIRYWKGLGDRYPTVREGDPKQLFFRNSQSHLSNMRSNSAPLACGHPLT